MRIKLQPGIKTKKKCVDGFAKVNKIQVLFG